MLTLDTKLCFVFEFCIVNFLSRTLGDLFGKLAKSAMLIVFVNLTGPGVIEFVLPYEILSFYIF